MIHILTEETIDRIAAGEVIERPRSVVKELVENAIDAGATAVSVSITGGGLEMIRVTDDGCGISADDLPLAFLRHATSKIESVEDLLRVSSLGFRGEALSSIAAVAKVQVTTKTAGSVMGSLYRIEGGEALGLEPAGAPCGTTFIVRDLFYNTPARRKFMKSAQAETNQTADLMERLALSRPDISFRFRAGNAEKLFTAGRGDVRSTVSRIYGHEALRGMIPVHAEREWITMDGLIAIPSMSRANRSYENYFINGRFIRSDALTRALEDAYAPYLMQHRFPFTVLYLTMAPELLDVNVHPSKMELRLRDQDEICSWFRAVIADALAAADRVPIVDLWGPKNDPAPVPKDPPAPVPEPYELKARSSMPDIIREEPAAISDRPAASAGRQAVFDDPSLTVSAAPQSSPEPERAADAPAVSCAQQMKLPSSGERGPAPGTFRLIGEVFDTYWLAQYGSSFLMIDQHAAHEKVLYEQLMAQYRENDPAVQTVDPPEVLTLTACERGCLEQSMDTLARMGFVIEDFGGSEVCVRGVPANTVNVPVNELLKDILGGADPGTSDVPAVLDRIATMSCKAAVKGNRRLSFAEAEELIRRMLACENPYNCPHGRPTVIEMTRAQMEKAFKRTV